MAGIADMFKKRLNTINRKQGNMREKLKPILGWTKINYENCNKKHEHEYGQEPVKHEHEHEPEEKQEINLRPGETWSNTNGPPDSEQRRQRT